MRQEIVLERVEKGEDLCTERPKVVNRLRIEYELPLSFFIRGLWARLLPHRYLAIAAVVFPFDIVIVGWRHG